MISLRKGVLFVAIKLCLMCSTNVVLAGDNESSKYTDRTNKFSIEYPVTWNSEKESGPPGNYNVGLIAPYDNLRDKFNENCNVTAGKKPENMSLDTFAKSNIANQRKYLASYHLFDKGEETIGGINSVWIVISYNLQGKPLKGRTYYFASSKMVYAITCTAESDEYSKYEPVFENIAKSFRTE